MSGRRPNLRLIKRNRTYSVVEIADRLKVHKNTVRNWQANGLTPIDGGRPALFHGAAIQAYLLSKQCRQKRPCPPGTFYCFHCREPRAPALGMVDFRCFTADAGNLNALCEACGTEMHRRSLRRALPFVMPGLDVRITEAPSRLNSSDQRPLSCDQIEDGSS